MGNKIITLPIMGEHRSEMELVQNDTIPSRRSTNGEPDNSLTLKQFQCGLELLQEAASEYLPTDLLNDSGVVGTSAENWERYKQIVRGIFAADDDGWGLLKIQYQQEPSIVKDCASVTITLSNDRITDNYGAMALSLASLLADKITTSVDEDGNVQICFTVGSIHATPSIKVED